jgi:hypothetical protein
LGQTDILGGPRGMASDMSIPESNKQSKVRRLPRPHILAATAVWIACISYGMIILREFSLQPGPAAIPVEKWPASSRLHLEQNAFTLVMILHPQCSCSQASLGELELLTALFPRSLRSHLLFVAPDGVGDDWVKGSLWQRASRMVGATPIMDHSGLEARLFGAITSGQTYLYDEQGRLLFSGGITAARGQAGDSMGRSAISALLQGAAPEQETSNVFGCLLF